ncbi:MAG: hypothetical protein GWM92_19755, partial [Gemmatimonadetes bacterium]|nr:hypothetical protein [Gemmatimonadota bacterium]NIR81054.1 hypothetical protein [Gemmatimonadota bacterium]NIT89872.1 hypothetical protein [Gemmatimonadota bacterium]NIU33671.1 hypothetical protein [Gemmatimonadota bacterium]NIU37914.1 hypothetical protein [Gemmatimonadota bacterium]
MRWSPITTERSPRASSICPAGGVGSCRRPLPAAPPILSGLGLFVALTLAATTVAAQQDLVYPGPMPGGYPSMDGEYGAAKMYMESYFPPPVTASPTYPAWAPDGRS